MKMIVASVGALFCFAGTANAMGSTWKWVRSDATNGGWQSKGGEATLTISGNKITGTLQEGNDTVYRIDGMIMFPNGVSCLSRPVCISDIKIKTITSGSDHGESVFRGTYRISRYDPKTALSFRATGAEYIVLSDTYNTLAFTRILPLEGSKYANH